VDSPTIARPSEMWPSLPIAKWEATKDTLQLWTQIAGKIRLALSPKINHWWQVPLYVNARGLTTSPIPYGERTFEIIFDFIDHLLIVVTCEGEKKSFPLAPRTVADFYAEIMGTLSSLGITVKIWTMPQEIPNAIHFEKDRTHCSYVPVYAHRFWRVLVSTESVFTEFRAGFIGKSSPVHFFWGSFDLAVTRFSGRRAPDRPGADPVTKEAYSHEVISAGFWPGQGETDAVFYCYAAPEPTGFARAQVSTPAAFYSTQFSEFMLKYEDVRSSASPRDTLLSYLNSTYDAAATLANWNRAELERNPPQK
jgi:Family of unknown function (DUF5996)